VSFGQLHLARHLPALLDRHPGLSIDLVLNDRVVDMVEEGYDVALRIGRLADSSLIARRLAPSRNRVMASPAYLEKFGRPEHPGDLKRHRCLIYANSSETSFWTFRQGGDSQQVAVDGPLRSNNGEILRDAAIAGAGLSIQPLFIAWQAVRRGELVPVLEDWTIRELSIQAVYPHRRHLSPKVRAFIDHLAGCFGDPPYWEG
jgi:DNA-binding transcriptional LysR family regulator